MFLRKAKILELQECARYVEQIDELSEYKIYQTEGYFCTLGTAAYQHKDYDFYRERCSRINLILWHNFEPIYLKLKDYFESFFHCKVLYATEALSLPGFHVFEIGRREQYPGGSAHFDLSYKSLPYLDWNEKSRYPPHYSFTLSMQLPNLGAGINIWDFTLSESTERYGYEEIRKICHDKNRTVVNYSVGEMVLFNGYHFHQIAEVKKTVPTDRRITMQGHLIYFNRKYLIYW